MPTRLRAAASLSALIAAVASVGFMLRAGHRNPSVLLIVLMAIWVVAPFAALLRVIHISNRRSFCILTMFIAFGAGVAYTIDALGPPRAKAATVFVLVPLISWILSGIVLVTVRLKRRASG